MFCVLSFRNITEALKHVASINQNLYLYNCIWNVKSRDKLSAYTANTQCNVRASRITAVRRFSRVSRIFYERRFVRALLSVCYSINNRLHLIKVRRAKRFNALLPRSQHDASDILTNRRSIRDFMIQASKMLMLY